MDRFALPPRSLPLPSLLILLFSGFYALFGWLFWGMGMIFFWIFFMNSEIIHLPAFAEWEPGQAIIQQVEETNAQENEADIYRYIYRYVVDADTFTGRSYVTGWLRAAGEKVEIEYQKDRPSISRIRGGRTEMFGSLVALVVIFPLVGLGFILFSLWKNGKAIRLLIQGEFARGRLLSSTPTKMTINDQPVYQYTFEFEAKDGSRQQVVCNTHRGSALEDEESELIIYLPSRPAYAVVYDGIPNAPAIQPDGSFAPFPARKLWVLLIPLLALLLHITWYVLVYAA
ncbi:MAG: DUF3592 domain-containing protein [Bacteroidetes bacterium]|nr:MAG: DUF3592 domain-containing protein [Bacteroidota bacterium]